MSKTIDNLLEFSDEVLLHILSHLQHNVSDLVHISHSCAKLDSLLQDKSICEKLAFNWFIYVERISLIKFLQQSNRAILITQLNMNDLYWVPSSVLRNVVLKATNLRELYIAGTSLAWLNLLQILKSSSAQHIQCLSYSWNTKLLPESKLPTIDVQSSLENKRQANAPWKAQIDEIATQLEHLKFLLIHIPEVFNTNSLISPSYSSLSYFIAKCTNLQQLFILSWPKTIQELKNTASLPPNNEESQLSNAEFPYLHTFVLSVMEPQRIYLPKLVSCVMRNLSDNRMKAGYSLKRLWLDHPLLHRHLRQEGKSEESWPVMDFSKIESLSLPLLEESVQIFPYLLTYDKCKTIQLTNGAPRIISLNTILDKAHNLESFCSKSFNYKLDWPKFIVKNPNLVNINVCEDTTLPYPEFCLAISSLLELRKLALPVYSLLEIKDSSLFEEFGNPPSTGDDGSTDFQQTLFFKRRRIGVPNTSLSKPTSSLSGIDILTKSCTEINEFELGFCKIENRPGKIMTDSLLSICRWTKLTRLTLDQIPITSGNFLIEIAKCCKLEYLRLSHLGPRAKCIYLNDLCNALTLCEKLVDFRFEQNYIGPSRCLFKSLEPCKELRRVLVFSDSNDRPLEENVLANLMHSCNNLSVLYVTIGSTPKYLCNSIRLNLESEFKRSRPPLSIVVRNGIGGESPHYPSVHYRQLVLLLPQVCTTNDFLIV